jgi:hypothetical protein
LIIDPKILNAFQKVHNELTNLMKKPIHWAVTGSLGMALHGMQMEIHDIDIQTDKDGAFEIERRLVNYLLKIVHFRASAQIRSYYGLFEINGIKVEVMGDLQHLIADQKWGEPVCVEQNRDWVDYEGKHIPVMTLEHEIEAYTLYGRAEKVEKMKRFLASL